VSNRLFGLYVLIGAQAFCFAETWYFGWNWTPQSPGEVICDALSLLLTLVGLVKSFQSDGGTEHGG
jgi:hypothetical protein